MAVITSYYKFLELVKLNLKQFVLYQNLEAINTLDPPVNPACTIVAAAD